MDNNSKNDYSDDAWTKIDPNTDLKDELKKIVTEAHKEPDEKKREEKIKQARNMIKLQLRYEELQRKLYQQRKAQVRLTQIFNKAINTHNFVLVVAGIAIAIAVILFALMVYEFFHAISAEAKPEERLSSSIMSAVFGVSGIGDIIVLMRYIMNRAQRALSDMIQTMIAFLSFTKQTDSLSSLIELKENDSKTSMDDLLKIIAAISSAEGDSMKNIEKYVDEPALFDRPPPKDKEPN